MKYDVITLPISGPQHRSVPGEIIENYQQLYKIVKEKFPNKHFSRFFPMVGNGYDDAAIRLMLVGRSPNGWTELNETTAEDFARDAACEMLNFGFGWLRNDGYAKNTYKDENGNKKRYNINMSAFFRTTRKIVQLLLPERASWERWFENIVWTNLYTISPEHHGNAVGKLQDIQLEISKKLLLQHIKFYKPTHILFMTDWDWWFDRFTDVFPNVRKTGNSEKDNVVGIGCLNDIQIVVSIRPDRTIPNKPNEDKFADDVFNAFVGNEL